MSKMTKPTVDVVRFTESDVIVASDILHLTGYNDNYEKTRNGVMTFRGIDYSTNDDLGMNPSDFYSILSSEFGQSIETTYAEPGYDSSIGNLFECDEGSTAYQVMAADGNYVWNGSMWKKQ